MSGHGIASRLHPPNYVHWYRGYLFRQSEQFSTLPRKSLAKKEQEVEVAMKKRVLAYIQKEGLMNLKQRERR